MHSDRIQFRHRIPLEIVVYTAHKFLGNRSDRRAVGSIAGGGEGDGWLSNEWRKQWEAQISSLSRIAIDSPNRRHNMSTALSAPRLFSSVSNVVSIMHENRRIILAHTHTHTHIRVSTFAGAFTHTILSLITRIHTRAEVSSFRTC